MVLKEFRCAAHGPFEEMVEQNETPTCPLGCPRRFVTREIRTAPKARGPIMGTIDAMQRDLAHDFGLSDLKVGRDDGKSVMENLRKGEDFSSQWIPTPGHLSPGWSQRQEKPTAMPVKNAFGLEPGNFLAPLNPPKDLPTNIVGRYKGDISKVTDA